MSGWQPGSLKPSFRPGAFLPHWLCRASLQTTLLSLVLGLFLPPLSLCPELTWSSLRPIHPTPTFRMTGVSLYVAQAIPKLIFERVLGPSSCLSPSLCPKCSEHRIGGEPWYPKELDNRYTRPGGVGLLILVRLDLYSFPVLVWSLPRSSVGQVETGGPVCLLLGTATGKGQGICQCERRPGMTPSWKDKAQISTLLWGTCPVESKGLCRQTDLQTPWLASV